MWKASGAVGDHASWVIDVRGMYAHYPYSHTRSCGGQPASRLIHIVFSGT
jgi:hypothetical protein